MMQFLLTLLPSLLMRALSHKDVKSLALTLFGLLTSKGTESVSGQTWDSLTSLIVAGAATWAANFVQQRAAGWTAWVVAKLKGVANPSTTDADSDLDPGPGPDDVINLADAIRPREDGSNVLRSLLFLIGVLSVVAVEAAPPRAVKKGPTAAVAGEFLTYDFSGSENMTGFRLDVSPKVDGYQQVKVDKVAKTADVATFEGSYRLALTVWNEDESDRLEWIVKVEPKVTPAPGPEPINPTPNPAPQPLPSPTPAPAPVLPDGRFGVIKPTRDLVIQVQSANKAAEIQCLIAGCTTVKSQIAAGVVKSRVAFAQAMGESLDKCLPAAWDAVRNQLADRVQELFDKGQLNTLSDCSQLLDELQQGLTAAL